MGEVDPAVQVVQTLPAVPAEVGVVVQLQAVVEVVAVLRRRPVVGGVAEAEEVCLRPVVEEAVGVVVFHPLAVVLDQSF